MVKLLVKKELKNLFRTYFVNQKSGKGLSKGKTISFILLFVFLMVVLMGMFFALAMGIGSAVIGMGLGWFYFAIMGMMALGLGVFGDVFNTYSMLYKAKDNELLLSLPIPPSKILVSRMTVVLILGALYESLVFIPTILGFWICGGAKSVGSIPLAIVSQILLFVFLSLFITTVTCILGWLVAILSNRLKHKNIAVLVLSVAFFCAYYFFCMKISDFINTLVLKAEAYSTTIRSGFYPAYAFGRAGMGSVFHTFVFVAFSAVTFAICVYVISLSFRKITTSSSNSAKAKYRGIKGKRSSVYGAVWKMEGKRFLSLPTYTLNSGLGIIMMPILMVLLLVKKEAVLPMVQYFGTTEYAPLVQMVAATMVASIASMDCGSAPSISLEGKSIWILQSSPVDAKTVMRAKTEFHFVINVIPAFLLALVGSIVLGFGILDVALTVLYTVAFTYLVSAFGMILGTVRANLNWTNPVVPIKQSMAVMITLFGGWVLAFLYPLGWYLMRSFMPPILWKFLFTALVVLLSVLCGVWCSTKGAREFERL
ncbi:MAG: hypothetical protein ACI4S4_02495 [Candidatus Ornithospirochaeta sp.]